MVTGPSHLAEYAARSTSRRASRAPTGSRGRTSMRRGSILRVSLAALAALALGLFTPRPSTAADIAVGSIQTASNREGAWLREDPRALGKKVKRIPFGEKVKVIALREGWARVTSETDATATGWCKVSDLVEPASLSGGAASAVNLGSSEVSLAGRQLGPEEMLAAKKEEEEAAKRQASDPRAGKQFDRKSEATFRTMDATLDAAYPIVDKLEKATPSEE